MSTALALVRHGQTAWNEEGRLQGSADIPLDATGREQAAAGGAELAGRQWDVLVSSPLGRAVETAHIFGQRIGLEPATPMAGLRERNYGPLEGQPLKGLSEPEYNRLHAGAEPEDEVAERGLAALRDVLEEYPGQRIVVVAHGTLIRLTMSALLGQPHPRLANCEVVDVEPEMLLNLQAA
ncbi:histidine phosphatase family protein [Arthrobacter castelli]|uniref:histidine phosphatase family protein n=1 Tax=Arthrobacter castelli TaxID=271431 RepID=UPI00040B19EF|nr:histidine phosphatase family protein [Arthrobacter castelli]